MPNDLRETGAVRPENGFKGSVQIPYPKFDLGRSTIRLAPFRQIQTVYATIDREGQQTARTMPCRHNAASWTDWRRR